MFRRTLLLLLLASTPGCASILASKHRTVPFRSEPTGAEVLIDGKSYGETPLDLKLRQNASYQVVFKLDGYQDQHYTMRSETSTDWVVVDILCGVFPALIDAATGDWKTLQDHRVKMDMEKGFQPQRYLNAFGDTLTASNSLPKVSVVTPEDVTAKLHLKLKSGREILARRAQPHSFGTVKVTLENGSVDYVDAAEIEAVTSTDGVDLYRRLLTDGKSIP